MSNADKFLPITTIKRGRASIAEIIVMAGTLAFGVNLLSSTIASVLRVDITVYVGFTLVASVALYAGIRHLTPRTTCVEIEAGLPIRNRQDKDVVEVPNYQFPQDFKEICESIFEESESTKIAWISDPITEVISNGTIRNTTSRTLVAEIVELSVLNSLGLHLSDYFRSSEFKNRKLHRIDRNDIQSIIHTNRALEIISRDPADRKAFSGEEIDESVISILGPGRYYRKFELTLPTNARITRLPAGHIKIKTRGITLLISSNFEGMNSYVPESFERHYLKCEPFEDIIWFSIPIFIHVEVGLWSAAFGTSWHYKEWVESFFNACVRRYDLEVFLRRINWDSIEASIIATSNVDKSETPVEIED